MRCSSHRYRTPPRHDIACARMPLASVGVYFGVGSVSPALQSQRDLSWNTDTLNSARKVGLHADCYGTSSTFVLFSSAGRLPVLTESPLFMLTSTSCCCTMICLFNGKERTTANVENANDHRVQSFRQYNFVGDSLCRLWSSPDPKALHRYAHQEEAAWK